MSSVAASAFTQVSRHQKSLKSNQISAGPAHAFLESPDRLSRGNPKNTHQRK
jgi:hypothetical protein